MDDIREGNFTPNIIYEGEKPIEFSAVPLTMMEGGNYRTVKFDSISELLERYYAEKKTGKIPDLRRTIEYLRIWSLRRRKKF